MRCVKPYRMELFLRARENLSVDQELKDEKIALIAGNEQGSS